MQESPKNIRSILLYTIIISLISLVYFFYAYSAYPIPEERETFLTEMGESFGNIGLGLLVLIYFRTVLKLALSIGM
jgi:hypothetical protein